jgi:DNA polymerase III subunit chi
MISEISMEILFYHLQRTTLEQTLPQLLEKTLARGWKAVVRASSPERIKALDDLLWTYRDDSFLPHGTSGDQTPDTPVLLTASDDRPEGFDVIFAVDSAGLPETTGWSRAVLLFDGNDEEALAAARTAWKATTGAGHSATYWQQDETGRWQQRA